MPDNNENLENNIDEQVQNDINIESFDTAKTADSPTVDQENVEQVVESSQQFDDDVNAEVSDLQDNLSDVTILHHDEDVQDVSESNQDISNIFSDISALATEGLNEEASDTSSVNVDGDDTVTIQPVKFAAFDDSQKVVGDASKNMDNLLDINLRLTVELGRTTLSVRKVLELTRGSIVELEKIAGEPVELFANGKLVAFGEVVVIEDNFGLRITSIAAPEERLKTVHDSSTASN